MTISEPKRREDSEISHGPKEGNRWRLSSTRRERTRKRERASRESPSLLSNVDRNRMDPRHSPSVMIRYCDTNDARKKPKNDDESATKKRAIRRIRRCLRKS
jgi:hypothetical protein